MLIKRISYTTTMALLLASSMLTTPVFAMLDTNDGQQQKLSVLEATVERSATTNGDLLVKQLISDTAQSPAAEVVTRPNGNLQSAPTFGEIAMVPVNLVARGLGALTQSALCAGGVKTVVKHDQPVSAFEAAAFERISSEAEAESLTGQMLELVNRATAIRQLDKRCPTVRAYDAAVLQRYANDTSYVLEVLTKLANTPKEKDGKQNPDYQKNQLKLQGYVNENYDLLKTLKLNKESGREGLKQAIVSRGLGVLPGTHAVVKCGYQYSLRPVLGGVLDRVGLGCSGASYDLRTDSKVTGTNFPAILNQGGTEACVAHAFSSALDFARRAQGLPNQTPSRSFIWSWTRQIGVSSHAFDGGPHKYLGNWGCSMNIAGDLVSAQGAPSEESDYGCKWYSDMKAHADADNTMTRYDSSALSATAHGETDVAGSISFIHQSDANTLLANVNAIKCAISSGYPVLIGIDVRRSSYYNADIGVSGDFVMPFSDGTVNTTVDNLHPVDNVDGKDVYGAGDFSVGGHAILLVGYQDGDTKANLLEKGKFTFMNSWGTWWGKDGFGTLPYEYVCGTSSSYSVPGLKKGSTGKKDPAGNTVNYAPFKAAPYAGYFGQIKSLTK